MTVWGLPLVVLAVLNHWFGRADFNNDVKKKSKM